MDELYDIVGYEGLYKINKNGDVWSCKGKKFLKPYLDLNGYLTIALYKSKDRKYFKLHRLIALNFIPNENPEKFDEIDHIDRNRTNNIFKNLRWVSADINQQNKGKYKNNKSGYRQISSQTFKTGEYWIIGIQKSNNLYRKLYNKNKYTIEEVLAFRNEKLLELGLEITD